MNNKWLLTYIHSNKKVSKGRAEEIIKRTDDAFITGPFINYDEFIIELQNNSIIPVYSKNNIDSIEKIQNWYKDNGILELQYFHNDWIASSNINGANGWMHPDGTIYWLNNIGKYPDEESIMSDLNMISSNFTDLDFYVDVFDYEMKLDEKIPEDIKPIFSKHIHNGIIEDSIKDIDVYKIKNNSETIFVKGIFDIENVPSIVNMSHEKQINSKFKVNKYKNWYTIEEIKKWFKK